MSADDHFVCVQSVAAGPDGGPWVLDPAAPGSDEVLPGGPKLVRVDLATDEVTKVIPFGRDVAPQGSYLNDVRFGPDGETAHVTDSGLRGAIIVVDLEAGTAFRAHAVRRPGRHDLRHRLPHPGLGLVPPRRADRADDRAVLVLAGGVIRARAARSLGPRRSRRARPHAGTDAVRPSSIHSRINGHTSRDAGREHSTPACP